MVGFWVLVILGIVIVLGACGGWFYYGYDSESKGHKIASIVTCIVLLIAIIGGSQFYLNGTENGERMKKSWASETGGGIERVVTVYDINGKVIKTYDGKFDVDYDSNRIIFDDNGKRHVVYYKTGTVTIDEK